MTTIQRRNSLHYGTKTIDYLLVKSKRIKTSEIIVEKDRVVVRTPLDKPLYEIEKVIQDKASWILKKQREYAEWSPQIIKPTFKLDSTLPFRGKNYSIKIMYENGKSNGIELVKKEFLVYTSSNNSKPSKKQIKELYEEWLTTKAVSIFKTKVSRYSSELQIKPNQIIVKKLKDRWGSATIDNNINLNVNLLKAPDDVIDYMILHELCHLKVKEHSHWFWDLVYKHMPNYQEKIDWLKVNGTAIV